MFKNLIILSVLGVALCFVSLTELKSSTASKVNFSDVKEDTKRFIRLNSELKLTPEQEQRYKNALSQIPAPQLFRLQSPNLLMRLQSLEVLEGSR